MQLKKFKDFADSLLPLEVAILTAKSQFKDKERQEIFEVVTHNSLSENHRSYNIQINKRKYSHLMNWMQTRLDECCTDIYYERLNEIDIMISSDNIGTEEEDLLLKLIKDYKPHHFHFIRFYEVVKSYLNFLLVRVRLNDYEMIRSFIHEFHDDYVRCKDLHDRMTSCASDVIRDYHNKRITRNSLRWINWLRKNLDDNSIDGQNQYQCLVLMSYLALMDDSLIQEVLHAYDHIEEEVKSGHMYSRKLLINFYGNKQLLLMKQRKHNLALYYGELSIRHKGPDYVMYLNNYSFNLLKLGQAPEALSIMKESLADVKYMRNRYNRSVFISSMIKCYNDNGMFPMAERYAENQLDRYEKDILEHNWYLFFRSIAETLIYLNNYSKLKKIIKKYQLIERESAFLNDYKGFAYFNWFMLLIRCKNGQLTEKKLLDTINKERDRMLSTFGITPSENVLKLIDHSLKQAV
ncbi:hypothetical protein [Robertkochia solimangrovi]|uniref:hypothetical protein n=1 Tax=Robertkochia solimangrovi TaxID=2213046 RepID=UPI00117C7DA0|nr:hypothetical protein [Robertkochia solimangrovi]TRZ43786.1 hypothetical protein DMZ48_10295 [Robertkochia solimangrovi]